MADLITTLATAGGAVDRETDPNWDDTLLLYHFDAAYGSGQSTWTDEADSPPTWSVTGTAYQGTMSPAASGYWSYSFKETTAKLTFGSSAGLALGTSDFTVECWIKLSDLSATKCIASSRAVSGTGTNYWSLSVSTSGELILQSRTSGGTQYFARSATNQIQTDTWYHVVAMRTSGQLRVFVDGVLGTQTSDNDSSNNLAETYVAVGLFNYTGFTTNFSGGLISNLRITKSSVYTTSGFTPPTEPISAIANTNLLTCRLACVSENASFLIPSNTGVKPAQTSPFSQEPYDPTIYGGTRYNPSGSELTASSVAGIQLRTSDFTVEIWCIPNLDDAYQRLVDSSDNRLIIQKWNQDYINYHIGGTNYQQTSTFLTNDLWHHLCIQKSSNVYYFYHNGRLLQSVSRSYDHTDYVNTVGGREGSTSEPFVGYLSGFRIVKGGNAYTLSGFTPEGCPAKIANTTSLLRFANSQHIDWTRRHFLRPNNANFSSSTVKFGDNSLSVGTSGGLTAVRSETFNMSDDYQIGTGPFTMECFLYIPNANLTGTQGIFRDYPSTLQIRILSGYLDYYNGTSYTVATTFPTDQWVHVAIVRENTSTDGVKIYQNGTLMRSATDSNDYSGNGIPQIAYNLNGFMDEFRLSKIARYTTAFSPPTAPFNNRK